MNLHDALVQIGLTAALSLTALVGCKKAADPAAAGGAAGGKKTIKIGMVAKSESNDVFQAAKIGALDAAKELGAKYGIDVQIDWRSPTDEDAQKQADAISALSNAKADAILVSCSDSQTLVKPINDAVDKGTLVVCFDSDAPESKRFANYATNDADLARKLVDQLAKLLDKKGTVAILAGNQAALNLQNRVKAAREQLKLYPEMKELNDGNGVFYHQETPEKAVEAIQGAMIANPNKINGWILVGGWPLFTDNALKFPPGSVKVVSCDALPKQLNYLKSGHVQLLVAQDCYGWGYRGVEIVLEKLVNGQDPVDKNIAAKLTDVTKDNADEFGKSWEKWLKH